VGDLLTPKKLAEFFCGKVNTKSGDYKQVMKQRIFCAGHGDKA
jgi:hypothetical protein